MDFVQNLNRFADNLQTNPTLQRALLQAQGVSPAKASVAVQPLEQARTNQKSQSRVRDILQNAKGRPLSNDELMVLFMEDPATAKFVAENQAKMQKQAMSQQIMQAGMGGMQPQVIDGDYEDVTVPDQPVSTLSPIEQQAQQAEMAAAAAAASGDSATANMLMSRANRLYDQAREETSRMQELTQPKPPSGYRYNQEGVLEVIPNSNPDIERKKEVQEYKDFLAKAQRELQGVQELLSHPGFESSVGRKGITARGWGAVPIVNWWADDKPIEGTDAAGFMALYNQIKGGAFLQAFESLKGGGAITQVEGQKAEQAQTRMDTSTSEEEFIKAANDYMDVIRTGMKRAKEKLQIYDNGDSEVPQLNDPLGIR